MDPEHFAPGASAENYDLKAESLHDRHVTEQRGSVQIVIEPGSHDAIGLETSSKQLAAPVRESAPETRERVVAVEEAEWDSESWERMPISCPDPLRPELRQDRQADYEDPDYEDPSILAEVGVDRRLLSATASYSSSYDIPTSRRPVRPTYYHQAEEINMLDMIHALRRKRRLEAGGAPPDGKTRIPSPVEISPFADTLYDDIPGPAEYHRFYWTCMELKSELIRLDFALRSVGSSGPGIQATNSVKLALRRLRDLYGTNTSALFPRDVNVKMYSPGGSRAYLTDFSLIFNDFGDALDELARALHDFNTVYHDEKLMLQLFSLHNRFKAEAGAISLGKGYPPDPDELSADIQVLLEDWVESAISSLKDAIKTFHEKGVPAILYTQNNTSSGYLNMTTIAFFLSGTTASMLQITTGGNTSPSGVAANTFLLSSLVFSVGSAVSSLLVMGWHKSIVRVPDGSLPLWLKAWLNAGPMVSLLIAGAFFVVALCLFAFSSGQHTVTSAITVLFSGIHASGLLFLTGYLILERWKFRQNAGSVGRDLTRDSLILSILEWANIFFVSLKRMQVSEGHFSVDQAESGRELGTDLSAQALGSEKNQESETALLNSRAVWHALSDEKFLLNSTFPFSDDGDGESPWRFQPYRLHSGMIRDAFLPGVRRQTRGPRQARCPSQASAQSSGRAPAEGRDATIMNEAFRKVLRKPELPGQPLNEPMLHRSRSSPSYCTRLEPTDEDRKLSLSKLGGSRIRRSRSQPSYSTRGELNDPFTAHEHEGKTVSTRSDGTAQLLEWKSQPLPTPSNPFELSAELSDKPRYSPGGTCEPASFDHESHPKRDDDVSSNAHESQSHHILEEDIYQPRIEESHPVAMASQNWEEHQESVYNPCSPLDSTRRGRIRGRPRPLSPAFGGSQPRIFTDIPQETAEMLDRISRMRKPRLGNDPGVIAEHAAGRRNGTDAVDHPYYRRPRRYRRFEYNDLRPHLSSDPQSGNVQAAASFLPNVSRVRASRVETPPRPR